MCAILIKLRNAAEHFKEMLAIASSLTACGDGQYWSSHFRTPRPSAEYVSKHALTEAPSSVNSQHMHYFTDGKAHWHPPILHLERLT